jgi:serine/threonine-protein kinase SRPK3
VGCERYKVAFSPTVGFKCSRPARNQAYVALKVSVANVHGKSRELKILRTLAELNPGETGARHVMQLLDHFNIDGPNGKHECLVLEFLGPSISDVLDMRFNDERLPGTLAKTSVQQALAGLAYLHKHKIGHGGTPSTELVPETRRLHSADLHTRNLAFAIPSLHTLTEAELLQRLRRPEIGTVTRKDGQVLEPGMPAYLVRPTSYPVDMALSQQQIKIIDFGESFSEDDLPETLHTPLCVRAPEVIFGEKLDYRVDLWSAGCMVSVDPGRMAMSQVACGDGAHPFHRSSSSLLANRLLIASWQHPYPSFAKC